MTNWTNIHGTVCRFGYNCGLPIDDEQAQQVRQIVMPTPASRLPFDWRLSRRFFFRGILIALPLWFIIWMVLHTSHIFW